MVVDAWAIVFSQDVCSLYRRQCSYHTLCAVKLAPFVASSVMAAREGLPRCTSFEMVLLVIMWWLVVCIAAWGAMY